jgi:hypothetical protein
MQIESFEKGCEICGYDPLALPDVSKLPAKHQAAVVSGYKLFVISEASWKGDGKVIDWNNSSQDKMGRMFYMRKDKSNPSGFRFYVTRCAYSRTYTTAGSRLCYPSDEDAEYHLKQHEGLYRDVMKFPGE